MMRAKAVLGLAVAMTLVVNASATADFYDLFLDGYLSDPNYYDDPNDSTCCYYDVVLDSLRLDPNLYEPNVVAWDVDNPMWQVWSYLSEVSDAWVGPNGLNLWTSTTPEIPMAFIGGIVNTPPYIWRLYPDMDQDPNDSVTFFNKDTSHYILSHMRWPDPDKGEGILALHGSPQGWTGMFLGIQKHPGQQQSYVYMHCSPTGGLTWYGPGAYRTLDLAEGVWMLFEFDSDGDTSVPNAPEGVPLWKSAVWEGDKYADAPTAWDDANYVLVTRADTGLPLVYKNFGSGWDPNDPDNYQFHEKGICLVGVYAANAEDLPAWIEVSHVECRNNAEFSAVPHTLKLKINNFNQGTVEIDPMLPDPNDPNTSARRLFRYTEGTEVVLTATPGAGKSFTGWTIYDPNYPDDGEHATVDTNAVLHLTMNADWYVIAAFKCGSSMPPFVMVAMLLVLGLGVLWRRSLR